MLQRLGYLVQQHKEGGGESTLAWIFNRKFNQCVGGNAILIENPSSVGRLDLYSIHFFG